ncbi:PTS sugar transporter subunit IIA [Otariodibacter sp.]|uniref:PTS sugar transporter subunit IIA n=1 Tax=Otariodibacter sp. TaxID=3030919 RepID=UPI002620CCEA|nr:PTS sugar transporter subunit IIA [Otariodibacter sp.]
MNLKQSLIENHSIKLHQSARSWKEAIKIGTDMLVKSGAVEERYYEEIINKIKEIGPYIILAPGLAMPHARPEDGVIRTAFALVTLSEPIYFDGSDDPIDVLLTLAGKDAEQHMQGLVEITQILDDPSSELGIDLDKVRVCKSEDDVYKMIDAVLTS